MKSIKYVILALCVCAANMLAQQQLNPGDGVRITFYNINEKISGDYFIQENGTLQLPFLGVMEAGKRNFADVKNDISKGYDSLYRNPEITIQPLFRINVLGEVNTPGLYYVTGVERLTGVIAMAGGETTDADLDNLSIIRGNEEVQVDAAQVIKKGTTVGDIGLQSGDRIYVPREWWVSAKNTTFIISGIAVLVTIVGLFLR